MLSGFEERGGGVHDASLECSYFLAIQPFSFLFSAAPRHMRKDKHVRGHMVTCNLVHVTLRSSLARSYFFATFWQNSSLAVLRQTILRDPTVLYLHTNNYHNTVQSCLVHLLGWKDVISSSGFTHAIHRRCTNITLVILLLV